jgi:Flp pilus assembly protein TadB
MSEYRKFLEAEYVNRKLSLYEKICNFFGRIPIPLPKDLNRKIQDEINFCHLRISPNDVVSTAIFASLTIFLFLTLVSYFIGILSLTMVLMFALLSSIIFYFLFSYTSFLTKYFRAKVASEMTLAIVYMSISLKINASLEAAVAFAASNLSGPLGLDLKKILWDLETGRLLSIIQGLDELSEKWKSENEEFVDAISLLKRTRL